MNIPVPPQVQARLQEFSPQDAQNMIALIQTAPLPGGVRQAAEVTAMLHRFQKWATSAFNARAAETPAVEAVDSGE